MPEISAVALLAWEARYRAIAAKSNASEARAFLMANRVPEQVRDRIAKAAIGSGTTVDSTLGSEGSSLGEWSAAARTRGAAYRIFADGGFVRLPWHARVSLATSSPTAAVVAEGKSISVSKSTLNNVVLTPQKVAAMIVISDELLLATDGPGQQMFARELLGVASAGVDTALATELSNGLTPITSTGTLADLRAAMLAVNSDDLERPYWLASTDVGKLAATLSAAKGGSATAAASAVGGELCNLPLLISSGVPSGTLYYLNAAQVCANGEAPTIELSRQADVEMSTTPTGASDVPTAAQVVSMFQTNSTALKSVALVAFKKLRTGAAAVVTGISSTTWAST